MSEQYTVRPHAVDIFFLTYNAVADSVVCGSDDSLLHDLGRIVCKLTRQARYLDGAPPSEELSPKTKSTTVFGFRSDSAGLR